MKNRSHPTYTDTLPVSTKYQKIKSIPKHKTILENLPLTLVQASFTIRVPANLSCKNCRSRLNKAHNNPNPRKLMPMTAKM